MTTPVKTEHPHVVRVPGVLGGEPVIAGTRIGVAVIARLLQAGEEPAEIIAASPLLSPAAVNDAVSYYPDHQAEVDRYIADCRPDVLAQRYGFEVTEQGKVVYRAK